MEPSFALGRHTRAHILQLVRIQNGQTNIFKHRHWVCISQDLTPDTRAHILQMVMVQNIQHYALTKTMADFWDEMIFIVRIEN